MADDEIIKRRLLIDGDGTGEARILTKFMKCFVKWCISEEATPAENQIQFDRLLAQLSSVEATSTKWSHIISMNTQELLNYSALKEKTLEDINKASDKICTTKDSLEDAAHVRSNREKYDVLAQLVKEHPPRYDTAIKLEALNQEIDSLKDKKNLLEQKLHTRRKQAHLLVTALHQLQQTLDEEETQEPPNQDLEMLE